MVGTEERNAPTETTQCATALDSLPRKIISNDKDTFLMIKSGLSFVSILHRIDVYLGLGSYSNQMQQH